MSNQPDAVEILLQTLNHAQRPLSIRRLLKLCREAGYLDGVWTRKGVELILRQSTEFAELRTGVFATQSQLEGQRESVVSSAPSAMLPEIEKVDNDSVFPESMTDVVALRESLGGRRELKRFLTQKVNDRVEALERRSKPSRRHTPAVESESESTQIENFAQLETNESEVALSERRQVSRPIAIERRVGRSGVSELSGVTLQIKQTLEAVGKPLSLDALQTRLNRTSARTDKGKLRMSVLVENERCRHQGYRELFVLDEANQVGLTSWGLPDRLLELELHMLRDRAEIEELVKRSLLNRLCDLPNVGFNEALTLMLERNGISDLREHDVHDNSLALMLGRQATDGRTQTVGVFAHNTWTKMGAEKVEETHQLLRRLNIDAGILISVGTFTEAAIVASKAMTEPSVQLIDGTVLANLFYQARLGLRTMTWTCCYPDLGFFKSLSEG